MVFDLQKALKKIRPVYGLNAWLKASQIKKNYVALSAYYAKGGEPSDLPYKEMQAVGWPGVRFEHDLALPHLESGQLEMLYVGNDYDQDSSGFLQSLSHFGHVHLFRQADGSYGQKGGSRDSNGERLIETVQTILKDRVLHLVLGQMWNFTMSWQALAQVRRMGVVVANICMDDRHAYRLGRLNNEWTGSAGLIPGLDVALTAAPEACQWYAAEGLPALSGLRQVIQQSFIPWT